MKILLTISFSCLLMLLSVGLLEVSYAFGLLFFLGVGVLWLMTLDKPKPQPKKKPKNQQHSKEQIKKAIEHQIKNKATP